jgi:anti-sigma factor RsiW
MFDRSVEGRSQVTCTSALELIEPYIDGELDANQTAAVAVHLETCNSCTAVNSRLQNLRTAIRAQAPYYTAPAHLQQRIRTGLRQAADRERPPQWFAKPWLAIAASILLAVSLGWNLALFRSLNSSRDNISQEVLSSHVRSLMGTHLLDVPSSDQHTVKPWFNGKLDFSPDVKDLASQGFKLIGGRLEYLNNRSVAVLVYQRRQHVINLFVWPATGSGDGDRTFRWNGYNGISWTKAGMTYWAVSDLNSTELQQFANLYRN